jgi:dTDP-4-amino-4,6-dideoxygalactose transaminase
MNIKFLDLKKNYLSIEKDINQEFTNLFYNCDFIHGEKVKIFENNFAKYLGITHFIGCANGTDALEIAIKSLNLEDGSEIIVQGNTYIATCLGVLNNNIKLVLCDIDPNTHMIDLEKLKNQLTNKTKAIIIVHLYGFMPDMDIITNICKENKLYLIEDCAQAHGAEWKNKKAGTFGEVSCFSFYPGKNLGAYGDGGGIGTNDDLLNEKIRKIANLGCKVKYHHELIGRNSRLDTLQASFLNVKLKYLDDWNKFRRINADIYINNLSDNKYIELPKYNKFCTPVYHLFVIKTKFRNELKEYLENNKVPCLIHYPISVSETEALNTFNYKDLDNCIKNSNEILSLPMYPELKEEEIDYICNHINNFFLEKNLLSLTSIKTDKPGILHYLNNICFNTKRIFYIDNFSDISSNNMRGFHANINFDELLICMDGKINIKLIDTDLNITEKILLKNDIFLIKRMKWIEYKILEENTKIVVLVNEILSKSKSIINFEDFNSK